MLKNIEKQTLTVYNKMELGEDISVEAKGKGRKFVSRFIEPGVAHYEEFGDVLITKETLNSFIHTMIGCPVIIQHKDIDDENADKERVGVISNVWFDEFDGWYYCDGIIWDKQAIDLIKNQGWSVSCTYDFDSDKLEKIHNGKKIDMEFTGGEFLHLALVPNPRYERANIVMNAKEKDDDIEWITVHGNHIPVKKGQSKDEAVKEFINKQQDKSKDGQTDTKDKHGFKKDKDSGYYMKDLSDGTSVYVEKKEGGQGEKEPFYLEATHFDKDGKTIVKKQYHYDSMDGMFDKIDKDFVSKDKSGDSKEKSIKDVSAKDFDDLNKEDIHYYAKSQKDGSITFLSYENQNKDIKRTELFDSDDVNVFAYSDNRGELKIIATPKNENVTTSNIKEAVLKGKAKLNKKYASNSTNVKEITMSVLNELESFIKGVIKNADDEDKKEEAKNEDKRKLIDEVGGILKGKVDDEIIKTIMKKMEEASYEPSEDDKADNKAKNADEEEKEEKFEEEKKVADNKCKNEEEKKEEDKKEEDKDEDDEVDKEEVKNKCKNSMKDVKEIIMGGKSKIESDYISKADRFALGEKY